MNSRVVGILSSCSFKDLPISYELNLIFSPFCNIESSRKGSLMKLFSRPVDLTSADTVIYHLPDGPPLSLSIDGLEAFIDLDLEVGHVCDTSEIDGTIHFFPRGNA